MPVIDLNKIRTENHWMNRVKDFGKRAYEKSKRVVCDTARFVRDKPQEAAALLGVGLSVVGGATKVTKAVNRHRALRAEKHHREREIYDRSLNMYLETKRKLTKKDFDRINEIKNRTGKRTSEVLSDLNLLKR